ncbi:excitatory amino acid transporter isoform X1 [Bemisia tabaci]
MTEETSPLSGEGGAEKATVLSVERDAGGSRMPKLKSKQQQCIQHNLLTIVTVAGVAGGVVLGFILRGSASTPWTKRQIMYVSFLGDLFLRMLKMMIIPLLVCSIVQAVGTLDLSLSKKIGLRAIGYYVATTSLAVIQGILWVVLVQPGVGGEDDLNVPKVKVASRNVTTVDTLLDLLRNLFPPNIIQATIFQSRTVLVPTTKPNSTEPETDLYKWEIKDEWTEGSNVLGLVMFAVVLGITLTRMEEHARRPLLNVFSSMSDAAMIITNWIIWLSPFGILFLVSSKMIEMQSLAVIVGKLGFYFLTVLMGLFCHGFILLPAMYMFFTKKSPIRFVSNMSQAIATAFGTASSNASLPVSMRCLEEDNGVDPRVSRFVMPIGATINMDGTALYEAVAAIFIAQVRQVPLSFGDVLAVSVTATFASIGAAGIPQAGLVTMVMVLDTVGLPAEDITLIIAVDWLLDRFRTVANVLGDALGAGIVEHLSKDELERMDQIAAAAADRPNGDKVRSDDEWNTTSM